MESRRSEGPLPAWMPSRRTLGGFYVQRQIGGGAAGTVFVVTRAEERHDPHAERFALKVPDYDATAARSLSEADFLKLFREEAGALLAIPEHENLARFVTFDAGARPKPILVMELIEGARCDKLIASRLLDAGARFALLDGVLAGLAAMHAVGVGHLDIKPSNVILRGGRAAGARGLRPGGAAPPPGLRHELVRRARGVGHRARGRRRRRRWPADVYSFGCLAFEVLTGETLFDAPNEVALISAHLMHDGLPPPLKRLVGAARDGRRRGGAPPLPAQGAAEPGDGGADPGRARAGGRGARGEELAGAGVAEPQGDYMGGTRCFFLGRSSILSA